VRQPLTERQREILDFLLSVETTGIAELRRQAEVAESRGRITRCCPSITLWVDRTRAPRSSIELPVIEAESMERADTEHVFDLLLFLDDGWLSTLELVHYGEGPGLDEFPPTQAFDAPRAYQPA
jgi:hypothetical protein